MSDPAFVAGLRPIPSGPPTADGQALWPATDIRGVTPAGQELVIDLAAHDRPVLLAFLTVHCDGCDQFWQAFGVDASVPTTVSPVIITKGPASVAAGEIAEAARTVRVAPVVMSDQAWSDYRVLGYPFFVLVDPVARTVRGETVGFGWSDVLSMIQTATG